MGTILGTSFLFFLFSMFLPGFKVTGSKLNYLWLTLGYLLLMGIVSLITYPLESALGFLFSILKLIPFIGGILYNFSNATVAFSLTFCSTFVLLIILDAAMESFSMKSKMVAFTVSLILASVHAVPLIMG
jgi:hypothetical protein